jgi:hypothetical protein
VERGLGHQAPASRLVANEKRFSNEQEKSITFPQANLLSLWCSLIGSLAREMANQQYIDCGHRLKAIQCRQFCSAGEQSINRIRAATLSPIESMHAFTASWRGVRPRSVEMIKVTVEWIQNR